MSLPATERRLSSGCRGHASVSADAPPALDPCPATIRGGEITGLVGPDGAGKTTLIRLMTGLHGARQRHARRARFRHGQDSPPTIQAAIGYMPQRFGLYEDLSVQENLDLYADLRGLPKAERPAVFDELLTFTDLKRFTARLAGKLSGGMKQKLGLACALLKKPRLLLARRARRRRRSDLAARAVEDGRGPDEGRHRRRLVDGLSRRGGGLRPGAAAQPGQAPVCRQARGADLARRRPGVPVSRRRTGRRRQVLAKAARTRRASSTV